MSLALAIIIVLVVGTGFLTFFIIRNAVVPQRVEALEGLLKRGKIQLAVKAAKQIIAKDPRNAEAHYYVGMAYLAEKRDDLAVVEFRTVNQLGVQGRAFSEQAFRENLAELFERIGQAEEALKEYLLLIKLIPNTGSYYYHAGKIFNERGRSDMAENYLNKAAELNPKDGKVHYELGIMLYRNHKAREAKAAFEHALRQDPEDAASINFYLGKIQKDAKEYTGALALFEKAARDQKLRIKALVERSGCYMALNAMEKAIPDLERAIKVITDESTQDSMYARYFLGICYESIREVDKAIDQWEVVFNNKKSFRDVGERLAKYQDLRGDDNLKDYITSSPNDFLDICTTVATQVLELTIKDARSASESCEIKAIENESAKWRNTRKMPRLIRFYRSTEPLEEEKVRSILDDAKAQSMPKAMLISYAGFSRPALEYANSRPVEMIGKEKLEELLKTARPAASNKRR